ncbi:MAG: hypothetical protein JOY70_10450, partial [Acidisphaera sp.]|nr:hypothetical protein [Acidisphaera sp.]
WFDNPAAINDYKAIYAPLHTPGADVRATVRSPRGLYTLLQDFTEHVDTDVSNDAAMLGAGGPPEAFGLYRDGNRLAALPKPAAAAGMSYAAATLAALPYALLPHPTVLLAGTSGGFRIREALALGASRVDALEPEPVVRGALRNGLGEVRPMQPDPRVRLSAAGPIAAGAAGTGRYDLIDLSGDFLDADEANGSAFAAEAIATYLRALGRDGIVSIPVSIREFPAYALRMLATVRQGLLDAGIGDPAAHVLAYRSAWNVRVLVSPTRFDAARIAAAKRFCDERSFDISFFDGMDVAAARAGIYNDLPPTSFESGEVDTSGGAHDAIADEAAAVLAGVATPSAAAFNLTPITYDRPSFYALLRLDRIGTILRRLELLPQAEIAPLVNLVVLAQAIVIALAVLAVPLFAGRRLRVRDTGLVQPVLYFAALGFGFLFIEIFLIGRASFYLGDRTAAFAVVLTVMLIFSGLGAMSAERVAAEPRRAIALAACAIVVWAVVMLALLQPLLLATLTRPALARAGLIVALTAPVSVALGMPFPLGLQRAAQSGPLLPWAWAVNGAFSVVATPLANLVALTEGERTVLLCAAVMYVAAVATFPATRTKVQWQKISAI